MVELCTVRKDYTVSDLDTFKALINVLGAVLLS